MNNLQLLSRTLTLLLLPFLATSAAAQSLENTSWQLVTIHGFNNTIYTPRNPDSYLLRFRLENRLQIEADCNQAGATYNHEEDSLTITELVTTRKLCIAPSLFNRYIMNLQRATSVTQEGETLIVRTASEADWMEFEPYVFVPNIPGRN